MSGDAKRGSLPPPITDFAVEDDRRAAATVEYQRQLASLDLDALEEFEDPAAAVTKRIEPEPEREPEPEPAHDGDLELEPEPPASPRSGAPSRERSATSTPNLEQIGEATHPPANRRLPTQPPSALALELERANPADPEPQPAQPIQLASNPAQAPAIGRQSPTPLRRGLFSLDRPTNLLAGVAIGLLLAVFPAKKLAESYEVREVAPRLLDLDQSVSQTLAVDAGLVERPEVVAASIHDGRGRTRQRFALVWLFTGLAIGAGLGFAPRPGD